MLSIPKPVRITQIAAGHEGHHALLLSEDGTLFFVGSARRGEDGDLSVRQGCSHRFSKPSRVKKFSCRLEAAACPGGVGVPMAGSRTPAFIAANHGSSAVVTKTGELYIFGKDAYHCNSKGLVNLMSKEMRVKSIVLGKAHMLILTVGGMVITAGFSNKGQCGLGQTSTLTSVSGLQQQAQSQSAPTTASASKQTLSSLEMLMTAVAPVPPPPPPPELPPRSPKKYVSPTFIQYHGHMFIFGKARVCRKCSKCTEFGAKCSYLRIAATGGGDSAAPMNEPVQADKEETKQTDQEEGGGLLCGCGEGNSGCIYCGICAACSKDVPICRRLQASYDPEDPLAKESPKVIKAGDLLKMEGGGLASSETGPATTATTTPASATPASETEFDSASIRIVAPTILPLSTTQAIVQIAAGLHHSVLLTDIGEVYTFGKFWLCFVLKVYQLFCLMIGSNQFGQLGTGDFSNRYTPTKVGTALVTRGVIRQIAAGSNHTVLLSSLGEVITFGNNQQGQLGRLPYNSCKLERYAWNAFPGKMENVGPTYGRIATWISSTGDFTYVKYDEMLLSANLLTSAKLVADRNSLILIPPSNDGGGGGGRSSSSSSRPKKGEDFDRLFEEKSCKHLYCSILESSSGGKDDGRKETASAASWAAVVESTAAAAVPKFNNLHPNILVISRLNGACSLLSPTAAAKALSKQLNTGGGGGGRSHCSLCAAVVNAPLDIGGGNQLNFDAYSSVLLDRYYHNCWTYNAQLDEFARFNLVELEAAGKMGRLHEEVHRQQALTLQQQSVSLLAPQNAPALSERQQHKEQLHQQHQICSTQAEMIKFPNSLFNLNQLNTLAFTATVFMQNVPSALMADITVPLVDYCAPRQTPQQLGIELLSFLTSLTYSHLLGRKERKRL